MLDYLAEIGPNFCRDSATSRMTTQIPTLAISCRMDVNHSRCRSGPEAFSTSTALSNRLLIQPPEPADKVAGTDIGIENMSARYSALIFASARIDRCTMTHISDEVGLY